MPDAGTGQAPDMPPPLEGTRRRRPNSGAMGWFSRRKQRQAASEPQAPAAEIPADPPPVEEPPPDPPPPPEPPEQQPPPVTEPSGEDEIRVSRTLVKSEPEIAALVASEPALGSEGVQVSLSEKGFGTRVAISACPPSGLGEDDLERLLDGLAEPQKRPFTNL